MTTEHSIGHALKEGSICFLSASNHPTTFATKIKKKAGDKIFLLNTVPFEDIALFLQADEYSLQLEMIRLTCDKLGSDGEHIVFRPATDRKLFESRGEIRTNYMQQEHALVKLRNPYDGQTILTKKLLDLSSSGMSITTNYHSKLFAKGLRFDDITVLIDQETTRKTSGIVIYNRQYSGLDGFIHNQIGFRLET